MCDLEQRQLRDKIVFVEESINKLEKAFGFSGRQKSALLKMAQGDELILLKMLMALHRRAAPLVALQKSGKVNF